MAKRSREPDQERTHQPVPGHEDDRDERVTGEELRPIPDGGLGASMPAWLKAPPAWAVRAPAPETAAAPAARHAQPRTVPPPDTSPIDPRALVRDEDLPAWLMTIGQRERRSRPPRRVPPVTERSPQPVPASETPAAAPVESPGPRPLVRDPILIALVVLAMVIVAGAVYLLYATGAL